MGSKCLSGAARRQISLFLLRPTSVTRHKKTRGLLSLGLGWALVQLLSPLADGAKECLIELLYGGTK